MPERRISSSTTNTSKCQRDVRRQSPFAQKQYTDHVHDIGPNAQARCCIEALTHCGAMNIPQAT